MQIYIYKQFFLTVLFSLMLFGCSCDNNKTDDSQEISVRQSTVMIQTAGLKTEGLVVCLADQCQRTDSDGIVGFEENGLFSFYMNQMYITSLELTLPKTLLTPYKLFENNDTLAQWLELSLYTFDKKDIASKEQVSLSFSPYIPTYNDFKEFIETNATDNFLSYEINQHSLTMDFKQSIITKDGSPFNITLISKSNYQKLEEIAAFIALADSQEVELFNNSETFFFTSQSMSHFTLGTQYDIEVNVIENEIILTIYDYTTGEEESAHYIELKDDNTSLVTDIVTFSIGI